MNTIKMIKSASTAPMLPNDIDAERGTLGSIMINPDALDKISDFLHPDDFYRLTHQQIYAAMLALDAKHERPDFITLSNALGLDLMDEEEPGRVSQFELAALINEVPTSAHIEHYAHIVEEKSKLRKLIYAASEIAGAAYQGDEDAVERAETLIHAISQNRHVKDATPIGTVVNEYMTELYRRHDQFMKGIVSGIPTGIQPLDRMLGGLQPSDLIVLAARPGVGKTSVAINIADYVAGQMAGQVAINNISQGRHVLIFSLEMNKNQLVQRMISMRTGINQTRLRDGNILENEFPLIVQAANGLDENGNKIATGLADASMWINDQPGISINNMRSHARRIQATQGLDLIVVDYLQLMKATRLDGRSYENRVAEVTEITKGLKEMARELNIPVLALAQLSRAMETRSNKMPQLSDLRESGSTEQDADAVLFIIPGETVLEAASSDPQKKGLVEDAANMATSKGGSLFCINVAKQRNGPTGDVYGVFYKETTLIEEL